MAPASAIRAHHVPSGSISGTRDRAKPQKSNAIGAIAAGVALASGWPEIGSLRRDEIADRPADAFSPLQWIGTNSEPRACRCSPRP
jgi:hypothetical protein